jgi:hypothetical protein
MSFQFIQHPTKRAPDAGDSAARFASSIFLRLCISPVGRLRRPRPSAGTPLGYASGTMTQTVGRLNLP